MNTIKIPSQMQINVQKETLWKLNRSQTLKNELLLYLWNNHRDFFKKNMVRLKRMNECCNAISYRRRLETGDYQLVWANFCKYDKACIACATKRAMRMIKKFATWVYENKLTWKNWYYIVLTISHKSHESFETVMWRLMKFKEKLGKAYRNSKRENQSSKSFFHKFDWMVMSIEVTYWKNWWHPHINILACTDDEIDIDRNLYDWNKKKKYKNWEQVPTLTNESLKNERKKITKWSFIHNIRKINVLNKHFSRSGIGEVFKYALKFSSMNVEQLSEIIIAQVKHQYRYFSTYGIFRGWEQGVWKKFDGERKEVSMLYDKQSQQYEIENTTFSTVTNNRQDVDSTLIDEIIASL